MNPGSGRGAPGSGRGAPGKGRDAPGSGRGAPGSSDVDRDKVISRSAIFLQNQEIQIGWEQQQR